LFKDTDTPGQVDATVTIGGWGCWCCFYGQRFRCVASLRKCCYNPSPAPGARAFLL